MLKKNHSKGISKYEGKCYGEVFTSIRNWALEISWQNLSFFLKKKHILGFLE